MLRLALWQGAGVANDHAATLSEVERIVSEAAASGAGLIVFPEGYLTGYHIPGLTAADLSDVEAALARVGRIAAANAISVVMGSHVLSTDGVRSAAVIWPGSRSRI